MSDITPTERWTPPAHDHIHTAADRLTTFDTGEPVVDADTYLRFLNGILEAKGLNFDLPSPSDVDTTAEPAVARVDHGRWIADCQATGCAAANYLLPGLPYLCGECFNWEIDHRWRPVVWPNRKTDVEGLLLERPNPKPWQDPAKRNWHPPETVEDLQAENDAMGV